jgi:iron complex outermembrane recepter protein
MSEFTNTSPTGPDIRRKLLTTVSAVALLGSIYGASEARAGDAERPQLWIELGGQLSRLDDGQEVFAPAFLAARTPVFSPSQKFEQPPRYSLDNDGKISFQPEGSDWILSASIRYGRSVSNRDVHQQTHPNPFVKYYYNTYAQYAGGVPIRKKNKNVSTPLAARFADTNAQNSERHIILDFQAGKDIGLGMSGSKDGSSAISVGVRFAQFSTRSNIALKSDPDWQFVYKYNPILLNYGRTGSKFTLGSNYHSNAASLRATRSFRGVGPSISWNASAPLMGNPQDSEVTLDWGVNVALLFGRQHAKEQHQTTQHYHNHKYFGSNRAHLTHQYMPPQQTRSRSVTVPNVGGFAGLSFRYVDAKISLGYRADLFFNAMDGGIDARKSENRGFYGPFASVSIGIGD